MDRKWRALNYLNSRKIKIIVIRSLNAQDFIFGESNTVLCMCDLCLPGSFCTARGCLLACQRSSHCVGVCVCVQVVGEHVGVSASACACTPGQRAPIPWDARRQWGDLDPLRCGSSWSAACVRQLATHSRRPWTWMWLHASRCRAAVSLDTSTRWIFFYGLLFCLCNSSVTKTLDYTDEQIYNICW